MKILSKYMRTLDAEILNASYDYYVGPLRANTRRLVELLRSFEPFRLLNMRKP